MYRKFYLHNGIPVVSSKTKDMRSVCIGIWVKVGSRHEEPAEFGISHFLEHMFFKGTGKMTAQDIAVAIDSMGGELNAFTSCESTTFYVKTLDEHLEKAIALLSNIFLDATFPEGDIEKEKNIIAEEIKMVKDTPSDYVHELFSRDVWGDRGLGHSVLGSQEIIETFTRKDILKHVNVFYGVNNIVVACSGNFNDDELSSLLNRNLGSLDRQSVVKDLPCPIFRARLNIRGADLSESHMCLGLEGIPYGSDDRYAMYLLNTILGSGFSSRLFQEIREKRGLAYSIYSFNSSYSDAAVWGVYAGTDKTHVKEVLDISVSEIRNLAATVTETEFRRAKDQLKGSLILALESNSNRMANLAKQELYFGRYYSPEDIISAVDEVTLEQVQTFARRISGGKPFSLTIYGPVAEGEIEDIRGIIS